MMPRVEFAPRAFDWFRETPLYPSLAGAYTAAQIAAGNALEVGALELVVVMALSVAMAAAITVVIQAALRGRVARPVVALIATLVVVWLLDAEMLADRGLGMGLRSRDALLVLSAATVGLVVLLLRTRRDMAGINRAARAVAIALPAIAVIQFAARRAEMRRSLERSHFVAEATQPLSLRVGTRGGSGGDLYLLLLDGYANDRVLCRRYGFDNAPFIDSLEQLGLRVGRDTRSNYGWTPPALASIFSARHVIDQDQDEDGRRVEWAALYYTIRHSRLLAGLRAAGYAVYLVPSAYFPGTRTTYVGDTYLPTDSRTPLMRLARIPLATAVLHNSVPGRILEKSGHIFAPTAVALSAFKGMRELAARPGPKVVVAHSLIAHAPFPVDAACKSASSLKDEDSAYIGAVRCTNREVLATVKAILAAGRRSTIVIMADHGAVPSGLPTYAPAEQIDSEHADVRFGAFRAALLPGGAVIPDSTTPVNVVRRAVAATLGDELADLPDSSYWSSFVPPTHYVAVDLLLSGARDGAMPSRGCGTAASRARRR